MILYRLSSKNTSSSSAIEAGVSIKPGAVNDEKTRQIRSVARIRGLSLGCVTFLGLTPEALCCRPLRGLKPEDVEKLTVAMGEKERGQARLPD
ncbi:MAG TPA: hypothetical protein VK612_01165 [Pyrinomonadaceae bacterium]|nr:hypothetical protein [Pyrinomonadaceae bacterium]